MSDLETQARAAGYGWDEIDEYTQGATRDALDAGYSQDEIDRYMGFDPTAVAHRADTAVGTLLPPVPSGGDPMLDLSIYDWRGQYANAMANGEVRGSYDWADGLAAAALDRIDIADPTTREQSLGWAARAGEQMAAQLPGRREFTDTALDVSGARPDDPLFDDVRRNLIGHWQDTGEGPVDAANRARTNTELAEKLNSRPSRGVLGEIGAGIARGAGGILFGIEHIANNVEATIADLFDSDELRAVAKRDVGELARREADWLKAYQRGEGITAFVAGTIGEAIPTVAEYVTAGVPRMVAYGALHGAADAWERTGSATAAYAGALISGAFAGAPAPFLHGAAGQGLMRAAVKGAIGMGAIGGLQSVVNPLVDVAAGKGYELPDIETIGEAAAGGAIVGSMFGSFAGLKPKVRLLDPMPDMPSRAVDIDAPELKPNAEVHNFAADLATKADQMERLRLENEGLVPGNATESGIFFTRRLAEMGIEGEHDPKQVQELAEGYRAGFTVREVADRLFGPLWRDETGGMKLGMRANLSDADRAALHERQDNAEQIIRYGEGVKNLQTSEISRYIDPLYKHIEPHLTEWRGALKSGDADRIMDTKIGQMIAHLEGEPGAELPADHPLRPAAEAIRAANLWTRAWMENSIAKGNMSPMDFVKDYWAHLWTDPANAERIFGTPTRARTVPTFREGIQAGLIPQFDHPIEHVFHDLTRKATMWNRADIIGHLAGKYDLDANGDIILDTTGKPKGRDENAPVVFSRAQPSGNMTPVAGMTRRGMWETEEFDPESGKSYTVKNRGELQAYASPEVARLISNWFNQYSRNTTTDNFIDKVNRASNTALALKLLLPVFHAVTTAQETVAGGLGLLLRGAIHNDSLADIAGDISAGVRFAKELATKGSALARSTPDTWNPDPLMDALLKGGFRYGKRQGVYMPGRAPNYIESYLRGTLGRELKDELDRDGARMIPYEVGRLATSISAPLFDYAIPFLKTAANAAAMQQELRQNPTMSREELFRKARQIIDNTDDRMGELNMDNVFWPRWVRRTLSMGLISPSWVYGTMRYTAAALGYRVAGSRGRWEMNPFAMTNLVGLTVAVAGMNMIYQWLKTGQLPGEMSRSVEPAPWTVAKDAAMDLIAPRTGGLTKGWAPARALLPGQAKEYLDWGKIVQETYAGFKVQGGGTGYAAEKFATAMAHYGDAKVRPLWNAFLAIASGHDAIGHDIAMRPGGWGKFLEQEFAPIFLNQALERRPRSGISAIEPFIGTREMPDWIQDQRRYWGVQQFLATKKTRDELRRWRKEQGYLRQ